MPKLTASLLPATPTARELWWVAVEGAVDPSGGWLVLADPGELGARQIQDAFAQAGIAILAAVDAEALAGVAAAPTYGAGTQDSTIVYRQAAQGLVADRHDSGRAHALLEARLRYPQDRLLLAESPEAIQALDLRMRQVLAGGAFEGVRMDLRSAPRGAGSWGLAQARAGGSR